MDLKELDYIVTVANEGSISRAAEKLFMAQSSFIERTVEDIEKCPFDTTYLGEKR